MTRDQTVWAFRVLWFLVPISVGSSLLAALDQHSDAVRLTTIAGAWTLWAIVLVASAVPLPVTLTALRALSPLAGVAVAWNAISGASGVLVVLAAIHVAVVLAVAIHPLLGDRFADGASYGDERRMLLRPPVPQLLVGVPVALLLLFASLVAGPLLLATGNLIVGGVAAVAGVLVIVLALRALHELSRRWVVFVPTGMVLHDYAVLTEPVLFRRTAIERLGAAFDGTPARDLTNAASGLQLECELADAAPLGLRLSTSAAASLTDVRRFRFCPTRPGALLDEAETRGIVVDGSRPTT